MNLINELMMILRLYHNSNNVMR